MELVISLQDVDKITIRKLRKEAERHNMSLNAFVLQLVHLGLAMLQKNSRLPTYHDLDDLAGTWSDGEATLFENAIADLEKIDKSLWL